MVASSKLKLLLTNTLREIYVADLHFGKVVRVNKPNKAKTAVSVQRNCFLHVNPVRSYLPENLVFESRGTRVKPHVQALVLW